MGMAKTSISICGGNIKTTNYGYVLSDSRVCWGGGRVEVYRLREIAMECMMNSDVIVFGENFEHIKTVTDFTFREAANFRFYISMKMYARAHIITIWYRSINKFDGWDDCLQSK